MLAALVTTLTLVGVARADALLVTGAGATFPFPLYSKWFSDYNKKYPELRFNYQSIGSGGGIKQITERTVEFGASDAPMTDEELSEKFRACAAWGGLGAGEARAALDLAWRIDELADVRELTAALRGRGG